MESENSIAATIGEQGLGAAPDHRRPAQEHPVNPAETDEEGKAAFERLYELAGIVLARHRVPVPTDLSDAAREFRDFQTRVKAFFLWDKYDVCSDRTKSRPTHQLMLHARYFRPATREAARFIKQRERTQLQNLRSSTTRVRH